jgi:hypothetical protein
MSMDRMIQAGEKVGLKINDMTKLYNYIRQDAKNVKMVYSDDINISINACDRVQKVASKYFGSNAEKVAMFVIESENIIMPLMTEMNWV